MKPYRHILCATDFSPSCDRASSRAAKLAREAGSKLTLLHVVDHFPVDRSNDEIAPEDMDPKEFREHKARARLEEQAARAEFPGAMQAVAFSDHAAAHEIVHYADSNEVDLIVVASHGHKGIMAEFGSTARAVQQHATCKVEVVPAADG